MTVKVNNKEFNFDGYVNPLNSVQKLAEECYWQGRADAIEEISREMRVLYGNDYEKRIRADTIDEFLTYVRDNADRYSQHKPNEGFSLAELIMLGTDFEKEQK